MSQLTFFVEEPLASHLASPDCEKDWMIRVATSCSPLVPLLQNIAPNGWYGRTSPASCPVTEDGILEPSSGCWGNSGMGSHTEFLTLSTLEYHSDAVVCSLSDVLETGEVPQRFFLSKRALKGIVQRDGVRGQFTLVSRQQGHALSMTERAMCWKSKASAQQPHLSMSD